MRKHNFAHYRSTAGIAIIAYLLLSLLACSTGTTNVSVSPTATKLTTPTEAVSPTATSLPTGTLLYQADWLHGLAGWRGSSQWKAVQGQLQNDASTDLAITVPYTPTVANYALDFRLQIINVPVTGGGFLITAPQIQEKDGYQVGVVGLQVSTAHTSFSFPNAQATIDPPNHMDFSQVGASMSVRDFLPHTDWHTYRIEVQDNQAIFYIDGTISNTASSTVTHFLSNGPIQLRTSLVALRVSNFRITSL